MATSDLIPAPPDLEDDDTADMPVPDRILKVAKELIARKGPSATTVRDICDAGNVNVASIHYYFGSKDALVKTVLLTILEPVNIERRVMLDEARRQFQPGPLPVPTILEALFRPLVMAERSIDGGRLFVRAESHLRAAPDSDYTLFVGQHMDGYAQMFIDALEASLPRFTRAEIIWRYEFVRGSAMHLLANCDPLSQKFQVLTGTGQMIDLDDNELVLRELLGTALLGLSAPAAWTSQDIER
ncbi:TetR family regulatory protein [Bordetella ansorpii]|uniref:TetR family regulatory protein n=1 Tax=Bordetella ansorpii TaxID=288768 RepID=A0A157KBY1_9BORD|nr:TetR/AcrR family transcriptional regulator [Bordetella ansorpii]SAH81870.1 TetR family regulatory protein [Bordetella ansorpii]